MEGKTAKGLSPEAEKSKGKPVGSPPVTTGTSKDVKLNPPSSPTTAKRAPSLTKFPHKPAKDENLTHTLLTIAPDGGWGWVIVLVSTWDLFIIDAVTLAYSVILEQMTKYLNISETQSSLLVSVFNCMVYLNGPITAAIANRFGFKILNIIGGSVCTVVFVACYWAPQSYGFVMTFFSVLGGIGASMICMVGAACPGYWFEAKRSLAFGIAGSSSGIAALAVPPMTQPIMEKFSWRAVFTFVGAMYAVAFAMGFLIKKPPMVLVEIDDPQKSKSTQAKTTMSVVNVRAGGGGKASEKLNQISQHSALQNTRKSRLEELSSVEFADTTKCERCWNRFCRCCSRAPAEESIERPLYKSDIFLASRTDVVAKQKKMTPADYTLSVHRMTTEKDLRQQLDSTCLCCPEAMVRVMKEMLDFGLFKNVIFLILVASTLVYFGAVYVTYLYLVRTCERNGLSNEVGVLTLQLFGAMLALSRILLGVGFHFFPNIPPHYFTAILVTAGGLCHASLALTTNKIATCILGGMMGFLIGVMGPMRSVLIVRYLSLDKLTNAVGMLFVFQALASLCGAPLAESLSLALNDNNVMFYFPGILYTISGLLIFPLEAIHRKSTKKSRKKKSRKSKV